MASLADAFTQGLEQEIGTAETLLDCLRREQQALQQLSVEALERAVADKVELLIQMHQHAEQRDQLLEQVGCGTSPAQIQTYIADHTAASSAWHRLVHLAGELDKQNRINGSMIQLSQQRAQMALDLISHPEDRSRTYGKQGYTAPGPSSFSRVKA